MAAIEIFERRINKLNETIEKTISDAANGREPIYDGAVNPKKWLDSPIKIMWLLKEPYEYPEGLGGGWSYTEELNNKWNYENFYSHVRTWPPIIYTTYGILNNFTLWNDMDDICEEMCSVVKNIAIVNTQKLPSKNVTRTDSQDLVEAVEKYQSILKEQIELLDPDIIIACGVFPLYENMFRINKKQARTKESITYYFQDKKLYIAAYHPSQRTVEREVYIDDIVSAAKEWYKTNR